MDERDKRFSEALVKIKPASEKKERDYVKVPVPTGDEILTATGGGLAGRLTGGAAEIASQTVDDLNFDKETNRLINARDVLSDQFNEMKDNKSPLSWMRKKVDEVAMIDSEIDHIRYLKKAGLKKSKLTKLLRYAPGVGTLAGALTALSTGEAADAIPFLSEAEPTGDNSPERKAVEDPWSDEYKEINLAPIEREPYIDEPLDSMEAPRIKQMRGPASRMQTADSLDQRIGINRGNAPDIFEQAAASISPESRERLIAEQGMQPSFAQSLAEYRAQRSPIPREDLLGRFTEAGQRADIGMESNYLPEIQEAQEQLQLRDSLFNLQPTMSTDRLYDTRQRQVGPDYFVYPEDPQEAYYRNY